MHLFESDHLLTLMPIEAKVFNFMPVILKTSYPLRSKLKLCDFKSLLSSHQLREFQFGKLTGVAVGHFSTSGHKILNKHFHFSLKITKYKGVRHLGEIEQFKEKSFCFVSARY